MRWKRSARKSSSVISLTTRFETHRSHEHRDQSDGKSTLSESTYSSRLITINLRYIGRDRIINSVEQKRGMSLLLVHSHGQFRFGWQSE